MKRRPITKFQNALLARAAEEGAVHPRGSGEASAARALFARALLTEIGERTGTYRLTDAGRAMYQDGQRIAGMRR